MAKTAGLRTHRATDWLGKRTGRADPHSQSAVVSMTVLATQPIQRFDAMKERGLRSSCPFRARMLGVFTLSTTKEAPVSELYEGRQFVGMDLHRRRSVLVRMTESGQHLETVPGAPNTQSTGCATQLAHSWHGSRYYADLHWHRWARTVSSRPPLVCKSLSSRILRFRLCNRVSIGPVQGLFRVHTVHRLPARICLSWHTLGTTGVSTEIVRLCGANPR